MNYWPLIGIALVVIGFALRLNPALTVVGAGLVTGLVAGKTPLAVLELLGEAFTKQRYLAVGHRPARTSWPEGACAGLDPAAARRHEQPPAGGLPRCTPDRGDAGPD
jgi:hypothetical protein